MAAPVRALRLTKQALMPRTTPPRPLGVEAIFPALAAHWRTTTRLHPRHDSPRPQEAERRPHGESAAPVPELPCGDQYVAPRGARRTGALETPSPAGKQAGTMTDG